MFMAVHMGDGHACILQPPNLSDSLCFNLYFRNFPALQISDESRQRAPQLPFVPILQSTNCLRRRHARAIDQYDVATHTQVLVLLCSTNSVFKGGTRSHQRAGP